MDKSALILGMDGHLIHNWNFDIEGRPRILIAAQLRSSAIWNPLVVLDGGTGRTLQELRGFARLNRWTWTATVGTISGEKTSTTSANPSADLAFRGSSPEVWRGFGEWKPAADFDGDGIRDVIAIVDDEEGAIDWREENREVPLIMTVRSGRDGRRLWDARISRRVESSENEHDGPFVPCVVPDLNGDGVADVLLPKSRMGFVLKSSWSGDRLILDVFSGKNGRQLWSAGTSRESDDRRDMAKYHGLFGVVVRDVDRRGQNDVLAMSGDQAWKGEPGVMLSPRFVRLNGLDGRVIWDQGLTFPKNLLSSDGGSPWNWFDVGAFPYVFADCDDDGREELIAQKVLAGGGGNKFTKFFMIKAFSLSLGRELWSVAGREDVEESPTLIAADFDGDQLRRTRCPRGRGLERSRYATLRAGKSRGSY